MIYIITVVILCILIIQFDLGDGKKSAAILWFNIITIWLILLSGFSYQVGSDIPGYMQEYHSFSFKKIESISDLFNFREQRQPLWVLLNYICHSISSNFVVLQLTIAAFCNWVISRFILKHSLYPFTTLLFYCLILYLNLNFNALRQFVAIAFFLMGYEALIDKRWLKYYALCLCAFLFHITAIICFFLPLLMLIPLNKKSIIIISSVLLIGTFYFLQLDVMDYAYDFVFSNANLMSDDFSELAERYIEDKNSNEVSIFGMIFIALQILAFIFILIVNIKFNGREQSFMLKLLIVYMVFIVLNRAIPIVFTRFMQYFDIFYCCLLPSAVIPFCRRVTKLKMAPVFILAFFAIIPISTLMGENLQSGRPLIVQYYPYYSVFNPKIDPQRSFLFGSYRRDE